LTFLPACGGEILPQETGGSAVGKKVRDRGLELIPCGSETVQTPLRHLGEHLGIAAGNRQPVQVLHKVGRVVRVKLHQGDPGIDGAVLDDGAAYGLD
jgi:hypothetical protein